MASLAMLHVTARMVGGHSGWLEVGWKLGALSCCACKTWRRWRLRAVVRAVMLSDCCAGAPCRDMGSWAGRILLTARAGGWERLESDVAQDSFATGFRRCAWDGWWCGLGVELGCRRSAACVCERGDAAAGGKSGRWGACRGESGEGCVGTTAREPAGWCAATLRTYTLVAYTSADVRDFFLGFCVRTTFCSGGSAGGKSRFSKFSFSSGSRHG